MQPCQTPQPITQATKSGLLQAYIETAARLIHCQGQCADWIAREHAKKPAAQEPKP